MARLCDGIKSITESHNEEVYTKEKIKEQTEELIEEKQQIKQEEFKIQEDIKENGRELEKTEKVQKIEDWQEEIQLTEIDIEKLDTIDNKENLFEQTKQKIIRDSILEKFDRYL